MRTDSDGPHSGPYVDCAPSLISSRLGSQRSRRFSVSSSTRMPTLTLPTKVPSDSLGWIGSLKRTSGKSLFPMALGSCGHRITHQLRPINMNGRSILSVTSTLQEPIQLLVELEVSSYRDFPKERLMQVWVHVGDYEVSIYLPYTDKRVQRLKRQKIQG